MKKDIHVPLSSRPQEDLPREKFLNLGAESLSKAELIAILIRSGSRDCTAIDLAEQMLIDNNGSLSLLGKRSVKELVRKYNGIGETKAITIIAAMELSRRRSLEQAMQKQKIICSRDAFDVFQPKFEDKRVEEFWMMLLNAANEVIDIKKITIGGINSTMVDIRILLKMAIEQLATSVIFAHNHPSGNINPSNEDVVLTRKLITAFQAIEIKPLDHLIICEREFYSFADEGKMM